MVPENRTSEVRQLMEQPLRDVRELVSALEGVAAGGGSFNEHRIEQRLEDTAHLLLETARALRQIPARFDDQESAALEARAESLRRYFSHTPDIAQRFSVVMNYFYGTQGYVALDAVAPCLVQVVGVRRDDALELARRRLERFKDCSLLEARRSDATWSYRMTDEARDFIDRGVFRSMGVVPKD